MYAIATPDFDVYVEVCDASNVDLAAFHLPGPNNGLPVGVPQGTIYGFAPMSANNYARLMERSRASAAAECQRMGLADVAPAAAAQDQHPRIWVMAEMCGTHRIGEAVTPPAGLPVLGDYGLMNVTDSDGNQRPFLIKQIDAGSLGSFCEESIQLARLSEAIEGDCRYAGEDVRTMAVKYTANGERFRSFRESVGEMAQVEMADFPYEPRTCLAYLQAVQSVAESSYAQHLAWLQQSRIPDRSRASFEDETLSRILDTAISYDCLAVCNLACFEILGALNALRAASSSYMETEPCVGTVVDMVMEQLSLPSGEVGGVSLVDNLDENVRAMVEDFESHMLQDTDKFAFQSPTTYESWQFASSGAVEAETSSEALHGMKDFFCLASDLTWEEAVWVSGGAIGEEFEHCRILPCIKAATVVQTLGGIINGDLGPAPTLSAAWANGTRDGVFGVFLQNSMYVDNHDFTGVRTLKGSCPPEPAKEKAAKRVMAHGGPVMPTVKRARRSVQAVSVPHSGEVGTLARKQELTKLEARSVSVECRAQYGLYLDKFKGFCTANGIALAAAGSPALADFMDLLEDGKAAHVGEKTVAALEFYFLQFKNQLPRARRALRGWRKARPATSRLALPRLAMYGIAMQMVADGQQLMGLMVMMGSIRISCDMGGATEDLCAKHRDFHGVKQRGRWLTDQSVRRYAKTGRVQQLLNKLDRSSMRYRMWAEKNMRKVFMGVQLTYPISFCASVRVDTPTKPHEVVIRWTHPECYNIPVQHYQVRSSMTADMSNPVEVSVGNKKTTGQRGELMEEEGPQLSPTSAQKRLARGSFALTQMKIKGLRPSTIYYFQVRACNQIGSSDWSVPSMPMKMGSCHPARCERPRFLSGNVNEGMKIYWQVPDTYGEGEVTRYDVRFSTHALMKEHRLVEDVKSGAAYWEQKSPLLIGSCGSEEARAAAGDRVFEIKIQRIDGSSQLVEVRPEMTGLQLKELIAQKLSISTDQRLICRGRAIKDDDMLGTHITDSGQIVHMVQRPPAAPPTVNAPNVPNVPSAMPMMPGMSGGIPGMSMTGMTGMPFPSQSQVVHIAVADFLPGMPPVPPPTGPGLGPGVGPGAPGPPGSSFTLNPQAERFTPQAERQTWSKSAPMSPPQSHPPMQGQPMQGVPVMPSFPLPPVPPPPMVTLPGPVGPMTMPPPQFPPPPMPVFLQQGVGLAQVIPQMLGAAEPAVPPPPPTLRHDGRAGALPWRDLRRLHSHLSAAEPNRWVFNGPN
ncbi:Ubiquitin-like domain-containing protein CIP73 (CCaMK-interacting protein of approximately 73 kDa) [Durusdinium trenchii]|uniref:Ubiquitin-like domain-containing protein CIP73 (CCaMK-interacting protein of approximately 73 kDa) n=1 Tax=Durusdinium trenchii TaxID=1381693 RepID=A0ABP0S452_9DINO